ncbi:PREDICTED: protein TPX2 [Populus euphratica]|uniref:Protein TPX2 n=1 Tax=Populus euphratica TaxID=75702 RepID=A0AAJ6UH07_POPEU|nr:PREDICTED: protein TPX2 [Populus euphratica]
MAAESEDSSTATTMTNTTTLMMFVDEAYEFSAPKFYDFVKGESDEDSRNAELWFDVTASYAPSPFMPRIKTGRSFKVETLCDFSQADQFHKVAESSDSKASDSSSQSEVMPPPAEAAAPIETGKEDKASDEDNKENNVNLVNVISAGEVTCEKEKREVGFACAEGNGRKTSSLQTENTDGKESSKNEAYCTPKPPISSRNRGTLTDSKKNQSARHIASLVKNPSLLKPKNQSQSSQVKGIKPASVKKPPNVKNVAGTTNLAQENQAIKKQKLEGGRSRQILNAKPPQPLTHKSKLGLSSGSSNLCSSVANKMKKEERKVYVREQAAPGPFVSTAEMMNKFQSNTRGLSLSHLNNSISHDGPASVIQRKPKLTLTRPKEPEFETAQRIRSVKIKSSAEIEEEMMAKIPKFKARPLNKKILEAATLPALPRSTPQPPEFLEFHLETAARANQIAESTSVASTEVSHQGNLWKPHHLTEPKTPVLHTSLRARPARVKSSLELEQEEIEKIPRFKARPLNKKIFESKGAMGIFCHAKKQVTVPQEFHFATNERIPPQAAVADMFDKLSLRSEPILDNPIPRNTKPNPFHLHTEERGAEKERKFLMELVQKQMEEERARVPRANPYPYTTDYPVVPPRPEPKPCTKPEPFQLESLVRHEEEMQREMEERERKEKEEAQMRIFKAQPVLKEDPIPVPEKARKPLTQVQQFNLHADQRAVERAEFDHKVKEKEMLYKRYREESETAKMMEEEKALKQLRRTMVPHARPVPNFNHPFCPQKSSKEATKAKSPNLSVLQRRERRRRMMVNAASSAAASGMR